MNKRVITIALAFVVALGTTGVGAYGHGNNPQHDTYDLDLDTEGAGSAASDDVAVQVEIDADGQAEVEDNPDSPDRTAFAGPNDVTVWVNVTDGDSHEIPVSLGGQGSSFAAAGVDGWALYLQGTDQGGAQFFGNFTLTGSDDGYAVNGEAILNVPDGQDTTTYQFAVNGEATFAPAD